MEFYGFSSSKIDALCFENHFSWAPGLSETIYLPTVAKVHPTIPSP